MSKLNHAAKNYDEIIQIIAAYTLEPKFDDAPLAKKTARIAFFDAIGCAMLALNYPACTNLLGGLAPGLSKGETKIPGTNLKLDPFYGAFNIGAMIRWLDYNDTWLAAEWGHPSDNLGAILAVAQYVNARRIENNQTELKLDYVLTAMIIAYEIQGVLALKNSFNQVGLDHVFLVKLASTAVCTKLLGGSKETIMAALSNAIIDGTPLRTYRHAPNTGSRKSWAAGDACARALWLSFLAIKGEMGYFSALSAPIWGFEHVSFKNEKIQLAQPLGSYVMENILFKVLYPAEFHGQTAVECAVKLYPKVKNKLADIKKIQLKTQAAAMKIINKTGPLHNPADRDHCLQYLVAVPLLTGNLTADNYEDSFAANPIIDQLRSKMSVSEDKTMSADYFNPDKRAIGNSIQIHFKDGTATDVIKIDYPLGHKMRRQESLPHLHQKFTANLNTRFSFDKTEKLQEIMFDDAKFSATTLKEFFELITLN